MSNILTLFVGGIIDYLLLASLLAAILTPLVGTMIKVARIRAPIYRHMIWLYALIGVVVFPAIWLYGPILTFEILPAEDQPAKAITPEMSSRYDVKLAQGEPTEMHSPRLISTEAAVMDHAIPPRPFPVRAVSAGMWLVGIVFMLTRLFIGWLRLHRICLSAKPVSGNGGFENRYGGRLKVLLTSQVDGPVCFGILQPVIILPQEMYDNAAPEDLQMALSHELAHIERWDCWTNLLQRVIEAIFFFHPFVWYASLQLTQQREQICDNYVIQKGARVMDYSKFLSRIAEQGLEKARFQAVALFEGRLVQRVRSLLDPKRSNQTKASRWATIAGAVAVMVCLMFGTVRLEAKQNVDVESQQPQSGGESDSDSTSSPLKNYSIVPQREFHHPGLGPRPRGNCSISGKVISAESGEPVGHATVCLYMEAHGSIFIEVASDGTFVFKDIPTGPFSLRTMNTAGFQDVYYNPEKRPGKYPKFSLGDAEKRVGVVLRVKPACSIAGKILDESGEPLRDQTLEVLAWVELDEPSGNLNRYSIAGRSRIASDGSYLLDGLETRPVYVMAIDRKSQEKDEFYPPCYYPGTVDRNKAKKVYFDDTKSVKKVDIHLQKKGSSFLIQTQKQIHIRLFPFVSYCLFDFL